MGIRTIDLNAKTAQTDNEYVYGFDGTSDFKIKKSDFLKEVTQGLNGKQPTINDLEDIRQGASDGTEALENIDNDVSIKQTGNHFSVSGDTVKFKDTYKNLNTGEDTVKEEVIPLADNDSAGLMSPADYSQIQNNTSRIQALEGMAVRLLYTEKSNPTAQEIADFVEEQGYVEYLESVAVVVEATNHIWHYYSTGWHDDGTDVVYQFTNDTAGVIKGSNTDGKVFAENDGTGSVKGWDNLKNRVSGAETQISAIAGSLGTQVTYTLSGTTLLITTK